MPSKHNGRRQAAMNDDLLSAPKTKKGRLQRALLELLHEHERDGAIPTNGRFLFYELEQAGVVPKHYPKGATRTQRTPATDVTCALTDLRQLGLIPWGWITDETRHLTSWQYALSVSEYVASSVDDARIDLWGGEEPPLLICEARGVMGVLEDLAAEYLVPITATAGQCGGFLVTEVAPKLTSGRHVGYIGDYEIRGPADQIEANTRRVLERHAGREFDENSWQRIALTQKQVNASKALRESVIEKFDGRYKPAKRYEAVECEAIKQTVLVKLVRKWLDARLPEPLQRVLEREAEQRNRVAQTLDDMDWDDDDA
jgi:hypothetical protein